MFFITNIDNTGILDVTGKSDWGRLSQGGHNTVANMMLYRVLTTGSKIATWQGDTTSAKSWKGLAATLKAAVSVNNYDLASGYLFKLSFIFFADTNRVFKYSDTDGSIHPEDGNSMTLKFNFANDS